MTNDLTFMQEVKFPDVVANMRQQMEEDGVIPSSSTQLVKVLDEQVALELQVMPGMLAKYWPRLFPEVPFDEEVMRSYLYRALDAWKRSQLTIHKKAQLMLPRPLTTRGKNLFELEEACPALLPHLDHVPGNNFTVRVAKLTSAMLDEKKYNHYKYFLFSGNELLASSNYKYGKRALHCENLEFSFFGLRWGWSKPMTLRDLLGMVGPDIGLVTHIGGYQQYINEITVVPVTAQLLFEEVYEKYELPPALAAE